MYYLKKYKFALILVIAIIIFILFNFDKKEDEIIELEKEEIVEQVEKVEIPDKLKVDIKGAVTTPGVYELDEGSRVSDAIEISGGLTEEADTSIINLSKNLKDEMVIIIYTKEEIKEMRKGTTTVKYVEKECICPEIKNDACIEEPVTNNPVDNSENSSSKISLNKATLQELMTLSGIGEAKAKLIIEYRENNGGFKNIEELKNVKGIGNSTYEKIKNYITT